MEMDRREGGREGGDGWRWIGGREGMEMDRREGGMGWRWIGGRKEGREGGDGDG